MGTYALEGPASRLIRPAGLEDKLSLNEILPHLHSLLFVTISLSLYKSLINPKPQEDYMNTARKIMPLLLIVLVSSCSYKYQYVARSADILIHKGRARTIWKSDSVEVIPDDSIIRIKLVYKKPVKDK